MLLVNQAEGGMYLLRGCGEAVWSRWVKCITTWNRGWLLVLSAWFRTSWRRSVTATYVDHHTEVDKRKTIPPASVMTALLCLITFQLCKKARNSSVEYGILYFHTLYKGICCINSLPSEY